MNTTHEHQKEHGTQFKSALCPVFFLVFMCRLRAVILANVIVAIVTRLVNLGKWALSAA